MSRTTTDPTTMLRPCPRCGLSLPVEAFGLDRRGYARGYCRPCACRATREWRARHRCERLAGYAAARLAGATSAEAKRAKDRRAIVPAVDTAPDTAGDQ